MHRADKSPLLQPCSPNTGDRLWMGVRTQYHSCLTDQDTTLINQFMLITSLTQGHTKNLCRARREIQNPWILSYPNAVTPLFQNSTIVHHCCVNTQGKLTEAAVISHLAGQDPCALVQPCGIIACCWCFVPSPGQNIRSLGFRDPAELVKQA